MKVLASLLKAAVSAVTYLSAKIVVSDGRWEAWYEAFLKALNNADSAFFEYHSWFTTPTFYCLAFRVDGGSAPFVVLGFVDSLETGQKYEFAAAWTANSARGQPQQQLAWGSGVRYASQRKVGKEVKNGTDLINAISSYVNISSEAARRYQRNDVIEKVMRFLESAISLFSYLDNQSTKIERLRVQMEKAGLELAVKTETDKKTVLTVVFLARAGKAIVSDEQLTELNFDPELIQSVMTDDRIQSDYAKALALTLRTRKEFEGMFTSAPTIDVKQTSPWSFNLILPIPKD